MPTLAVHGDEADPIAQVGAVRAYADQIDSLAIRRVPRRPHDILNETVHRDVAAEIVTFIGEYVGE